MKYKFKQQYPNANISKFEFDVGLDDNGKNVESKSIYYILNSNDQLDITSDAFKNKYSENLYWPPHIWSTRGTVQNFVIIERMNFHLMLLILELLH